MAMLPVYFGLGGSERPDVAWSQSRLSPRMDTPAAAPSQPWSGSESDLAPEAAGTIPWVTFGGSPNESSSVFVQRVQRIGFQQGRSRDDAWMADYAATCFEGDALAWYAALDAGVQENWKSLRASLLLKYPPVVGGSNPLSGPPMATITPSPPVAAGATSASTGQSQRVVGRIEILTRHSVLRGYVTFDVTTGIGITPEKDKAALLSGPRSIGSDVMELELLNAPSRALPYLGLALLVPQGKDQDVVPKALPGISTNGVYAVSTSTAQVRCYGVPEPSSTCKHHVPENSPKYHYSKVDFATWTFSACGESNKSALYRRRSSTVVSGTRAAAAVWKYDSKAGELAMYWLTDDDAEMELGGYVHRATFDRLHVHRISDMNKTGGYILEERVRFLFSPIEQV